MKFNWLFRRSIFLVSASLLTFGCQKESGGTNAIGISVFVAYSYSPGATYTITLNGEPVGWATGSDDYFIRGYPIRQGTNQVVVKTDFSPDWVEKMPRYYNTTVSMHLCTQETLDTELSPSNWATLNQFNEVWTTNKPYVYQQNFLMKNRVLDYGFEDINSNRDFYVNQCRSMSVKLAKLIQNQDYNSLARVFGLTNFDFSTSQPFSTNEAFLAEENNLVKNCPELCPGSVYPEYAATNKDVSVTGIADESEVNYQAGAHLILLYCNFNKHFASFANRKLIDQSSSLKSAPFYHYGIVNVDCFVFGHANGKWKFTANGFGWLDLNQDVLDNINFIHR